MVGAFIAALILAGCGGGSDGNKAAGDDAKSRTGDTALRAGGAAVGHKACDLVTRAEVEAAVGSPAQAPGGGGETGICRYNTGGGQVLVISTSSPDNAAQFDSLKSGVGGPVESVNGLGDRAFIVKGQAYVLKGPVLVAVTVLVSQPPAKLNQAARQLAQLAVTRV